MEEQRDEDNAVTPSVDRAPACTDWSVENVADWIESLGYKEYRVNTNLKCTGPVSPSVGRHDKHDLYTSWAVIWTSLVMAIN